MAVDVRSFPSKALLSAQLGAAVAEVFAKHPPSRPFTVAISGGSLPKLLAAGLSKDSGIDFARWVVFFADERLVPLDHGDSNFKACDEALFQPLGIPRANVHTADSGLQGHEAAAAYAEVLHSVVGGDAAHPPAIDLVLLGMGCSASLPQVLLLPLPAHRRHCSEDGHTCSLFPGHPLVQATGATVLHLDDSPKMPPSRITLTLPVLNAASNVFFVCTGGGKADALVDVLGGAEGCLPAGRVQPTPGRLVWFVDDDASVKWRAAQPSAL